MIAGFYFFQRSKRYITAVLKLDPKAVGIPTYKRVPLLHQY